MGYNHYRKRTYNRSNAQKRKYAEQMKTLDSIFDSDFSDWSLSSMRDSCYKEFPKYVVRISNHSADNKYHDIQNHSYLLVNIKASKLEFLYIITNTLPVILKEINKLDLSKYRFINVVGKNINCYYKGFKTKKDVFTI